MSNERPDLSPLARGYAWAFRIMTASTAMVVPGLVGLWLDTRFGSRPWLTVVGFGFGLWLGTWRLIVATKADTDDMA